MLRLRGSSVSNTKTHTHIYISAHGLAHTRVSDTKTLGRTNEGKQEEIRENERMKTTTNENKKHHPYYRYNGKHIAFIYNIRSRALSRLLRILYIHIYLLKQNRITFIFGLDSVQSIHLWLSDSKKKTMKDICIVDEIS